MNTQDYKPSAQKSFGKYIAVAISPTGHTERLGKNVHLTQDGTDTRSSRRGQKRFVSREDAIAFAKSHTDIWNNKLVEIRAKHEMPQLP